MLDFSSFGERIDDKKDELDFSGFGEQVSSGRSATPMGQADPRRVDAPAANQPPPYKNRLEALDDAVNLLEEGAPTDKVRSGFERIGLKWDEIISHGQKRGSEFFKQQPTAPVTAPRDPSTYQPSGEIKAFEPSALDEVVNTVKRGVLRTRQESDTLKFQTGIIDSATFAERTRENERRMGAAAPSGDVVSGLERLQEANKSGSYLQVARELINPANFKATAALLAESAIPSLANIPYTIAGGAAGGPVGAGTATAAASFASEYANALDDTLEKRGIDKSDAIAVRRAIEDPEVMAQAREYGVKRGIPVAIFDGISAGFAGRFIRTLERAVEVTGKAATRAAVAGAAGKEAALQVGSGMAGEFGAQKATGENKPLDVLIEGLAELPGGVFEVGTNVIGGVKPKTAEPTFDAAQMMRDRGFFAEPTNFTPAGSPTQQAGMVDIVVPVPTVNPDTEREFGLDKLRMGGVNVGTPGTPGELVAGSGDVAGDLTGGSLGAPGLRVGDTGRAVGGSAASNAPDGASTLPLGGSGQQPVADLTQKDNNANTPVEQWFGRRGDGYRTEADAQQALPGRQRMFPALTWQIEAMPSGKFRLAGYSQETNLGTETAQAQQSQAQGQAQPIVGSAGAAVGAPLAAGGVSPANDGATAGVGELALQPGSRPATAGALTTPEGAQSAGLTAPIRLAPPAPLRTAGQAISRLQAETGLNVEIDRSPMTEQQQAASGLARMLGKTVTILKSEAPGTLPNGFVIPEISRKDIFIANDADDAPLSIVAHEVYHTLPDDKRQALNAQLLTMFREDKRGDFATEFGYDPKNDKLIDEEIPAFMAQAISKRADFWEQLRDKMGNREFAGLAKVILDKLTTIIGGAREEYGDGFVKKYIKDVEKARDLLSTVYSEAMQEQGLTPDEQPMPMAASNRSRIDMNFKDVIKRTPELQEGMAKLQAGEITKEDYDRLVNEFKPVEPYKSVPAPVTPEAAKFALANGKGQSEEKAAKFGLPSREMKAGESTQLRLDIPSYSEHGAWVVSVHRPEGRSFGAGKVVGYEPVASVQNAEFGMLEKSAAKIAAGSAKGTIATIMGDWKPTTSAEAKLKADQALKSKDWVQVGMDPERHSYFYDRATMEPVTAADEVIQIGPLVLAKNPTYGKKSDFMFSNRVNEPEIGAKLRARIESDYEGAVQEYSGFKGTKGGRVLDADIARELSPEYRADRSRAPEVHEAVSDFVQRTFEERMAQPSQGDIVVFMAGGGGAGKSSAEELLSPILDRASTVLDGTLSSYDKAERNVQRALDSGRKVAIAYVYRDPIDALTNGVLTRAKRTGRAVPIDALVKGHAGSSSVVRKLQEKFGDNPNFKLHAVDNSLGQNNAKIKDIKDITPVIIDGLKERLLNATEQQLQAGQIDDKLYRATVGRQADAGAEAQGAARVGEIQQGSGSGVREGRQLGGSGNPVKQTESVINGIQYSSRVRNLSSIPTIELKDLLDKKVFGIKADLTDAGVSYTGIDGSQLQFPVEMMGGPRFVQLPQNVKSNVIWAVRGGATLTKILSQGEKADYIVVVAMNGNSHLSNATVSTAYLQTVEAYLRDGRISRDNLLALDEIVRSPDNKSSLPDFPGFESPDIYNYIDGLSFDQRAALAAILEKKEAQAHGLPNLDRFRRETLDTEYAGYRQGDAMLVIELDKKNPTVKLGENGTKMHPSYPLGLRGKVIGKLAKGINYEVMFPDYFQFAVPNFKRKEQDAWYSFDRLMPIQKITQKIVDSVSPGGYQNIKSARQAEAALAMANNNWLVSGKTKAQGGVSVQEFVDALRANDGAAALTLYTPEEVKSGVKAGTFSVYQLGKQGGPKGLQVFFGLKRGAPWYKDMIEGVTDNEVEIVSVTNNELGAPGVGIPGIITKAISEGATVLDAFAVKSARFPNGFLPEMYAQFGFEEIGRIPFDPSYYDANGLADLKAFWSRGGWKESDGFPDVVVMRWKGKDEDRATAIERYVRSGETGVSADVPQYTRAAAGESDQRSDSSRGAKGRARRGNAAQARGNQGAGDAASVVKRAYGSIQELATLSDGDIRNLGLDPAEVERLRDAYFAIQRSNRLAEPARGSSARPDAGDGSTFTGIHYGKSAGLQFLSGISFGTGIKGAEQARLAEPGVDPRIKKRVYFYLTNNNADMPRPELGLGSHVYRATLGNMYDPGKASAGAAKRIKDLMQGSGPNAFESAVLDAGYRGYVNREMQTAVVLNADVPVAYEGLADASRMRDRVPDRAAPRVVTRTEGDELVRKPTNDEMTGIIKVRPALATAAPSFKLQFGEVRVKASEAAEADRVLADAGAAFQFGEVMRSNRVKLADDLAEQEKFLQQKAEAAGYKTIDEFVDKDYDGFAAAAKEWRDAYPVDVMYSNRAAPDTPEFKRWFGDSKVVDADGKPMVMYHITAADFDAFDTTRRAIGGEGSWFSSTPPKGYGDDGENIMPVYLSLQNPKIIDKMRDSDDVLKEQFIKQGYDGVIMMLNGKISTVVAFNPTQIKSATGNGGEFDPNNPSIVASNRARESWIIGRDELGRPTFGAGAKAYRYAADVANNVLGRIGLKPISTDLGRAMRQMKVEISKAREMTVDAAEQLGKLSEQEREMISDVIEGELKRGAKPPKRVLELAASMQGIMSEQTAELVRLGMLSEDAAGRWDGKYLPRFYESKLKDEGKAWLKAAKSLLGRQKTMQGISGGNLKGRGLFQTIPVEELEAWLAEGWEERDPNFDPDTDTEITVWRDYTRQERDDMGEIRDSMFRFVMGYNKSQRDISLGRLYENLANTVASKKEKDGYVQVPRTNVEDTYARRYGKLAGMWVPQEVLDHLVAFDQSQQNELLKMYLKGMSMWKEGKTVLNPVSHANNVMSNVTMAHFAGVSYWDVNKYIGATRDLIKRDPMVTEAEDAGLWTGTMTQAELIQLLPDQLKVLAAKEESKAGKAVESVWNAMSFWLRKPLGKAYEAEDLFFRYLIYRDARQRGLEPADAVDFAQKYIFTYDDLPKNARRVRDFALPFFAYTYKVVPTLAETVLKYPWRYAAPAMALYTINAAMYAFAAGADDDWWEIIKRYATDADFRKKAKDLEADERPNLPEWMKGQSLSLGTQKTIRLGVDELTSLPVFLDVSRIFPGGDIFDMHNNAGGMAWPAPITPNNPILTTLYSIGANKDTFRGKELTKDSDTTEEKIRKRAAWVYQQITPAIAVGNSHFERAMNVIANQVGQPVNLGFAEYTGIDRQGQPVQGKYAAMQTVGIKARPIDLELSAQIQKADTQRQIREIGAEISSINRLESRGAISSDTAERQRDVQREKRQRLKQGLTVDGDEKE